MEQTQFQMMMDQFSLQFSSMCEAMERHGARIHNLIDLDPKHREVAISFQVHWKFLEHRAKQLDGTLCDLDGTWPIEAVETFSASLDAFIAAGHLIVGEAMEDFGMALPYINVARAAYTMVEYAVEMHKELGEIIDAGYKASRGAEAGAAEEPAPEISNESVTISAATFHNCHQTVDRVHDIVAALAEQAGVTV